MSGRGFLIGAGLAIGGLMLVPGVAAAVARASRPVVRRGLRTGAAAYDHAMQAAGEAYEQFEDVTAEVKAEMDGEARAAEGAGNKPDEASGSSPSDRSG